MAFGKDIKTRDGLGGVHKVQEPRQTVPDYAPDASNTVVARGSRAGESRLVTDKDQVARTEHTVPAPIEPRTKAHTPESEEEGARTPEAPHQDARITPTAASAWEASPPGESKS